MKDVLALECNLYSVAHSKHTCNHLAIHLSNFIYTLCFLIRTELRDGWYCTADSFITYVSNCAVNQLFVIEIWKMLLSQFITNLIVWLFQTRCQNFSIMMDFMVFLSQPSDKKNTHLRAMRAKIFKFLRIFWMVIERGGYAPNLPSLNRPWTIVWAL